MLCSGLTFIKSLAAQRKADALDEAETPTATEAITRPHGSDEGVCIDMAAPHDRLEQGLGQEAEALVRQEASPDTP